MNCAIMTMATWSIVVCWAAPPAAAQEEFGSADAAEQRLVVARQALALLEKLSDSVDIDIPTTWTWSVRLLDAELATSQSPTRRLSALQAHLSRARKLEVAVKKAAKKGYMSSLDVMEAEYRRLTVEWQLLEEQKKSNSQLTGE